MEEEDGEEQHREKKMKNSMVRSGTVAPIYNGTKSNKWRRKIERNIEMKNSMVQ